MIDNFEVIKTCIYKSETYSVRDNGAIMRHAIDDEHPRKLDNKWDFGKQDSKGYLKFGGESVHRIVATAFHGAAPSSQHVVDHIDTNRCNNRPENLRWLTKLENILLNEITRNKIIYLCGSVESFLEDPSQLNGYESENSNFSWMRAVTKEEAAHTLQSWKSLLQSKQDSQHKRQQNIGEWIYGKNAQIESTKENIHQTEDDIKKQKELEKKLKAEERKRQDALDREDTKAVLTAINDISNKHDWECKAAARGRHGKYHVDIIAGLREITFDIYKDQDNIKILLPRPIEFEEECDKLLQLDLSFTLAKSAEGHSVLLGSQKYSLETFILYCMNQRVVLTNNLQVKYIKVRFMQTNCRKCRSMHHIYHVWGMVNELVPDLACMDGMLRYGVEDNGIDYDHEPIVVNAVQSYLQTHQSLHYKVGEINERYSHTRDESYMSFGCPYCDNIMGEHFREELIRSHLYSEDDQDVHIVKLEGEGITVPVLHWEIKE